MNRESGVPVSQMMKKGHVHGAQLKAGLFAQFRVVKAERILEVNKKVGFSNTPVRIHRKGTKEGHILEIAEYYGIVRYCGKAKIQKVRYARTDRQVEIQAGVGIALEVKIHIGVKAHGKRKPPSPEVISGEGSGIAKSEFLGLKARIRLQYPWISLARLPKCRIKSPGPGVEHRIGGVKTGNIEPRGKGGKLIFFRVKDYVLLKVRPGGEGKCFGNMYHAECP